MKYLSLLYHLTPASPPELRSPTMPDYDTDHFLFLYLVEGGRDDGIQA